MAPGGGLSPDELAYIRSLIERDKRLGWLGKGLRTVLLYVAGVLVAISTIWTLARSGIKAFVGG